MARRRFGAYSFALLLGEKRAAVLFLGIVGFEPFAFDWFGFFILRLNYKLAGINPFKQITSAQFKSTVHLYKAKRPFLGNDVHFWPQLSRLGRFKNEGPIRADLCSNRPVWDFLLTSRLLAIFWPFSNRPVWDQHFLSGPYGTSKVRIGPIWFQETAVVHPATWREDFKALTDARLLTLVK